MKYRDVNVVVDERGMCDTKRLICDQKVECCVWSMDEFQSFVWDGRERAEISTGGKKQKELNKDGAN